jgi:hypothetical protein
MIEGGESYWISRKKPLKRHTLGDGLKSLGIPLRVRISIQGRQTDSAAVEQVKTPLVRGVVAKKSHFVAIWRVTEPVARRLERMRIRRSPHREHINSSPCQ